MQIDTTNMTRFTSGAQRIGTYKLPDGRFYFVDLDRDVSGITTIKINPEVDLSANQFVMDCYKAGAYDAGPHDDDNVYYDEFLYQIEKDLSKFCKDICDYVL